MTVIAVYHIKGGVGKSATCVNLAWLAAAEGYQTLICDMDPQGASTWYYRIKPGKAAVKKLLKGKGDADKYIKATDYERLDLLPADNANRYPDLLLGSGKRTTKRVRDGMRPLADQYDLVFLDCPPNLSLYAENIFTAADVILAPVVPTPLSERTLDQLDQFLNERESNHKLLPFFSMVESRKKMHSDLIKSLRERYPQFLSPRIPYLTDVERMGIQRLPLFSFKPRSPAALAYRRLWADIRAAMKLQYPH